MSFALLDQIDLLVKEGRLPRYIGEIMLQFFKTYINAITQNGYTLSDVEMRLKELLKSTMDQIKNPYAFEVFHERVLEPFNYYRFGNDFIKPLIDLKRSQVFGQPVLDDIEKQLAKGENVIFLANHQIEPDPQVISIMLETDHPRIAEEMIFIAGHRVITDPVAIPFSMGRNLICIYSKRHVEHPPEQKADKLLHNRKALKKMEQLLSEGGKCFYIAPSGGRDRPDARGVIMPAPFDSQSIEMILLISKQAAKPTHFYPLTLATYKLLPPPKTVELELGETRSAQCAPAFLYFDEEIDLDHLGKGMGDKKQIRKKRAEMLWKKVNQHYLELGKKLT